MSLHIRPLDIPVPDAVASGRLVPCASLLPTSGPELDREVERRVFSRAPGPSVPPFSTEDWTATALAELVSRQTGWTCEVSEQHGAWSHVDRASRRDRGAARAPQNSLHGHGLGFDARARDLPLPGQGDPMPRVAGGLAAGRVRPRERPAAGRRNGGRFPTATLNRLGPPARRRSRKPLNWNGVAFASPRSRGY